MVNRGSINIIKMAIISEEKKSDVDNTLHVSSVFHEDLLDRHQQLMMRLLNKT
jgi:hypothetical protein